MVFTTALRTRRMHNVGNEVTVNCVEWLWNRALSCQTVCFYAGMDFTRREMRFARRRSFENKQTILSAAFSGIRMSLVWILWDNVIDASKITNIKSWRGRRRCLWRWSMMRNNEENSLTSSQHRVFYLRISSNLCDVMCWYCSMNAIRHRIDTE